MPRNLIDSSNNVSRFKMQLHVRNRTQGMLPPAGGCKGINHGVLEDMCEIPAESLQYAPKSSTTCEPSNLRKINCSNTVSRSSKAESNRRHP